MVAGKAGVDGIYIIIFIAHFHFLIDVGVVGASAGQAELVLPSLHFVDVVGHKKELQIEPRNECREAQEQPLPVQDPLHHRFAPSMPAEREVFQNIKDGTVQRRDTQLHLFLGARRFWPKLYAEACIRANVRLQVELRPRCTLRSLHPVAMEVLQEHQQKGKGKEPSQCKKDGRFALWCLHCVYERTAKKVFIPNYERDRLERTKNVKYSYK